MVRSQWQRKRKVRLFDTNSMCQHGHYWRQCSLNEPGSGTGTGLLLLMTTLHRKMHNWCGEGFVGFFVNENLCKAATLQHCYFWKSLQACMKLSASNFSINSNVRYQAVIIPTFTHHQHSFTKILFSSLAFWGL